MRFFTTALAGASALVSLVAAQSLTLQFRGLEGLYTVGVPTTISYVAPDLEDPVTITLRRGESGNLDTIATLTSSATGGSYRWTPDEDLPVGADYALQITQGDEINYSGQFTIAGGPNPSTSTLSSGMTTSTETETASITATVTSTFTFSNSTTTVVHSNTTTVLTNITTTVASSTITSTGFETTTTATEDSTTATTASTGVPTDAAVALTGNLAFVAGIAGAVAYLF